MTLPTSPLDRRQVLKALAAAPILASALGTLERNGRPASSTPATPTRPSQQSALLSQQSPHGHRHLIGVL